MKAVKTVEQHKSYICFLFQMRDGSSVAVSLRTVGYVTVSVSHLNFIIMNQVALPLSALIFCLLLSLYRDFEKVNENRKVIHITCFAGNIHTL